MHRAFSPRGRTPGLWGRGCGAAAVGSRLWGCGCGIGAMGAEAVGLRLLELRLWDGGCGAAAVLPESRLQTLFSKAPAAEGSRAEGEGALGRRARLASGLLWWRFCQDLLPGVGRAGWGRWRGRGAARPAKQQLPIICERVGNRAPCHARARAAVGA